MPQTAVAQINVRLPRMLKDSGDAGLEELNLSPSDAVRTLWTRLSERGEGLDEVREFLLGRSDEEPGALLERSALEEGWQLVDAGLTSLGLTEVTERAAASEESDADLLAAELEERMRERGLM